MLLVDESAPETEPEAEPEMEPEAVALVESDEVELAVLLAGAGVAAVDWAEDDVEVASTDDVSLIVVLLLCVSREQPGPKARAAATKAVAPNIVRLFFMSVFSRCGLSE